MEYQESIKDIKFESTEQISLSRNDIISVAKDHNLELSEEEIQEILLQTIKDLDFEINQLSDEWDEFAIKAIEKILKIEVEN